MEGLQNVDMEHVVYARPLWQSKMIRHIAHTFQYLVRTGIARAKLAPASRNQWLSRPMEQPKPHPVPDVESQVPVVGVVVALGVLLCLL